MISAIEAYCRCDHYPGRIFLVDRAGDVPVCPDCKKSLNMQTKTETYEELVEELRASIHITLVDHDVVTLPRVELARLLNLRLRAASAIEVLLGH